MAAQVTDIWSTHIYIDSTKGLILLPFWAIWKSTKKNMHVHVYVQCRFPPAAGL